DDFKVSHENSLIVQKDDYYPFGMSFNSYTSGQENLYKYSGKEEQKETGLIDFGARMYDPAIGRWGVVDPMAGEREWLSQCEMLEFLLVSNQNLNLEIVQEENIHMKYQEKEVKLRQNLFNNKHWIEVTKDSLIGKPER
ncbi:RHS repeat domain-containing protein, partial [Echinicola pacifica]